MSLDVSLLRQEVASVTHLTLVKVSHLIVSALKLFLWESFSVTRGNDMILFILLFPDDVENLLKKLSLEKYQSNFEEQEVRRICMRCSWI